MCVGVILYEYDSIFQLSLIHSLIFLLLFQAAGIAAFALFGWMLTDSSLLLSLTRGDNDLYIGLLVFVGVATLVIVIAFLGCCGALKESQCMLVSVGYLFTPLEKCRLNYR